MQAKLIFFLALLVFSPEAAKVVIETSVPEADFFLDGNLVAKTDARGSLTIENFPAGSFRFSIKKEGYLPYEGSFTVTEGKSDTIRVHLLPIEPASADAADRRAQAPGNPSSVQNRPLEGKTPAPGAARAVPATSPPPAAPKRAAKTVAPAGEMQAAENETNDFSAVLWTIAAGLVILLVLVFMITRRRPRQVPMEPQPESMEVVEEPAGVPLPRMKQPPEFVDQLRRREELIQAGLVSVKPAKEVVIVLPKEAYTSSEEEE